MRLIEGRTVIAVAHRLSTSIPSIASSCWKLRAASSRTALRRNCCARWRLQPNARPPARRRLVVVSRRPRPPCRSRCWCWRYCWWLPLRPAPSRSRVESGQGQLGRSGPGREVDADTAPLPPAPRSAPNRPVVQTPPKPEEAAGGSRKPESPHHRRRASRRRNRRRASPHHRRRASQKAPRTTGGEQAEVLRHPRRAARKRRTTGGEKPKPARRRRTSSRSRRRGRRHPREEGVRTRRRGHGRVVEALVDSDGRPRAAVVAGGFLGVGSRKIAIDWELLQFRPADREQPCVSSWSGRRFRPAPEYKPSGQPAAVVAPPSRRMSRLLPMPRNDRNGGSPRAPYTEQGRRAAGRGLD